jgi:hypothetical protein
MCAIGCDIAQGGPDNSVLATRFDGYYPKLIVKPGRETPDGPSVAGMITAQRRNGAAITIDMGGGYGGSTYDHLKENGVEPLFKYKGADGTNRKTQDGMSFVNFRSYAYWNFRCSLDPSEYQGSPIALDPTDNELISDLTAPQFELTRSGIKITPKEELVKKLGRSPDRGDAVVIAWLFGPRAKTHITEWRPDQRVGNIANKRRPKVNYGRHHRPRRK